ncbi:MAG: hypothetical protein GF364_21670 [Candidatus Lokiarchaeota archaeon]|nr:hypothetical protein [Candidatus Lokiarchaeota archaeon]
MQELLVLLNSIFNDSQLDFFKVSLFKYRFLKIDSFDSNNNIFYKEFTNFFYYTSLLYSINKTLVKFKIQNKKKQATKIILKFLNSPEFSDYQNCRDYLGEKREYIQKAILALLSTFQAWQLMGRVKRTKLLFLLKYESLRRKAIEINQRKSIYNTTDEFIPGVYGELLSFQKLHYGPYEYLIKSYERVLIIKMGYAVEQKINNAETLKLTEKGKEKIEILFYDDEQFRSLVNVCKQLARYFDHMGGKELEKFIKKDVFPEWDETRFGGFYREFF